MIEDQQNRMQKNKWTPAPTAIRPAESVLCCTRCASLRVKTLVTRPESDVAQMRCEKCGTRFTVRNVNGINPEARETVGRGRPRLDG
jgi:transcription elongation factor Elf1